MSVPARGQRVKSCPGTGRLAAFPPRVHPPPVLQGCSPRCGSTVNVSVGPSLSSDWPGWMFPPSAVTEPESAHVLAGCQRTVSPLLMHRLHGPRGQNLHNSSSEFGLLKISRRRQQCIKASAGPPLRARLCNYTGVIFMKAVKLEMMEIMLPNWFCYHLWCSKPFALY